MASVRVCVENARNARPDSLDVVVRVLASTASNLHSNLDVLNNSKIWSLSNSSFYLKYRYYI